MQAASISSANPPTASRIEGSPAMSRIVPAWWPCPIQLHHNQSAGWLGVPWRHGTGAAGRCWNGVRSLLPLLALGWLATGCDATPGLTDRAFSASGQVIAMGGGSGGADNACFSCHGLAGQGDGVSTPRLAGLDQGYLQKQMEDYANGLRPDDVMTRVARGLDQHGRQKVAAWYAGLPPPPPPPPPDPNTSLAVAPQIWLHGDVDRGV